MRLHWKLQDRTLVRIRSYQRLSGKDCSCDAFLLEFDRLQAEYLCEVRQTGDRDADLGDPVNVAVGANLVFALFKTITNYGRIPFGYTQGPRQDSPLRMNLVFTMTGQLMKSLFPFDGAPDFAGHLRKASARQDTSAVA